MSINLRDAEEKDIPSILEIINYEILNSTVVYDYNERSIETQLEWFKKKKKDGMPVIVAEENNVVLGYGTYGIFRPWDAYKFSLEHSIYVSKSSRGKGIGILLMEELIRMAKQNGYHTLIAGIDASNKNSIDFHKKFGFYEVGNFKEVGYKFERWLDLTFMQLILK